MNNLFLFFLFFLLSACFYQNKTTENKKLDSLILRKNLETAKHILSKSTQNYDTINDNVLTKKLGDLLYMFNQATKKEREIVKKVRYKYFDFSIFLQGKIQLFGTQIM